MSSGHRIFIGPVLCDVVHAGLLDARGREICSS